MKTSSKIYGSLASVSLLALVATGCSSEGSDSGSAAADGDRPAWCGDQEVTIAFADGFGGNSWRQINSKEAADEISKCPSVQEFLYSDAQGDTQKAVSDINSFTAQGVDGMVIFPDAGEAMLPAIRQAYKAGVVTVPYRVSPGGEAGTDYNYFVETNFRDIGTLWGEWLDTNLPEGGNVLFLGGPPANSQDQLEYEGMVETFKDRPDIKFIGTEPFTPTDWDPAQTQQVMSAMLATYDQIDAVVSDFAATSILTSFEQAGREIPLIATQDSNGLACKYTELKDANPKFEMMTSDNQTWMVRSAIQFAVAEATGGEVPDSTLVPQAVFEDSISGTPQMPLCDPDMPDDALLSSKLSTEQIKEALN